MSDDDEFVLDHDPDEYFSEMMEVRDVEQSLEIESETIKPEKFEYNYYRFPASSFVVEKAIEYKRVDIEDFKSAGFITSYEEVVPNEEGYVTKDLFSKIIEGDSSNTVVINIATGSGKTTAIYQLVRDIMDRDKQSVIIMAPPFIALVDKDQKNLVTKIGIEDSLITNYKDLSKDVDNKSDGNSDFSDPLSGFKQKYIDGKRIHITTINGLLRNPGELAFSQKIIKTNYFESLLEYCKNSNKNVYLFLDEIHASIHNFKNEYIYFLTMWKKVIRKCIVSTATYTEPVNIVVKHLAYLTNDKIQVLEAKRVKAKEISPLDIVFLSNDYGKKDVTILNEFLHHWIKSNLSPENRFHILCYSKALSKVLYVALEKNYKNLNLLTSETKKRKIGFDKEINSIGTNFATGVDIDNPDDLLIIIFPWKYSDELVKGEEGIFNDGLPSILQSVARLRVEGRILFVVPPMKAIIDDDATLRLMNTIPFYNQEHIILSDIKIVKEQFLNKEKNIFHSILDKKTNLVKKEIERYNDDVVNDKKNGIYRPVIQFPERDTSILERGHEYLKNSSYKSGKYITPYVIWAAVNNQYINCKLNTVYYHREKRFFLRIKSDNIDKKLKGFISAYGDKTIFNENFERFYNQVCKIFNFIEVMEDGELRKQPVYIYFGDEHYTYSRLKVKNEFFFSLVRIHQNLKFNTISNRDSYLKYAIENSSEYYYKELRKLRNDFVNLNLGKVLTVKEISKLPWVIKNLPKIKDCMNSINFRDSIMYKYCKELNRSSISLDEMKMLSSFLNYFVNRGPEGKGGRREILW